MDYDRLALFLAGYTTGGFRRSLRVTPQATLTRCGFNPAEAAQLAASMARHTQNLNINEIERVRLSFQQITWSSDPGGKSMTDDWSQRC